MFRRTPRATVVLITALLGFAAVLPIRAAAAPPADAGPRARPAAAPEAATPEAFLRGLSRLAPDTPPSNGPAAGDPAAADLAAGTEATCLPCTTDTDCGRCCGLQSIHKCGLNHVCICQFLP